MTACAEHPRAIECRHRGEQILEWRLYSVSFQEGKARKASKVTASLDGRDPASAGHAKRIYEAARAAFDAEGDVYAALSRAILEKVE